MSADPRRILEDVPNLQKGAAPEEPRHDLALASVLLVPANQRRHIKSKALLHDSSMKLGRRTAQKLPRKVIRVRRQGMSLNRTSSPSCFHGSFAEITC